MNKHVINRRHIVDSLKRELVGPAPAGKSIDCSVPLSFSTWEEARGPWLQKETGEEILNDDIPSLRYGVGVLHLQDAEQSDSNDDFLIGTIDLDESEQELLASDASKDIGQIAKRVDTTGEVDDDDFDISLANARKPQSMAISFLVSLPKDSSLSFTFQGGRYIKKAVKINDSNRTWWLRQALKLQAKFTSSDLRKSTDATCLPSIYEEFNTEGLSLDVRVLSRLVENGATDQRLLTVCVINRSGGQSATSDTHNVFQSGFTINVLNGAQIIPYPKSLEYEQDEEEQAFNLLYRDYEVYAVGHGCAADWAIDDSNIVTNITAECMPVVELPSTTPDVVLNNGKRLSVSMARLADVGLTSTYFAELESLIHEYETWIERKTATIPLLQTEYHRIAKRNMNDCMEAAKRMRDGLAFLQSDPSALRAFQLANKAILLQQIQGSNSLRHPKLGQAGLIFDGQYKPPDLSNVIQGRGSWRAFQIAFILINLHAIADPSLPEREIVELIWFPTGGGKTEAYLGLAAYATFLRRIKNPEDIGVNVLMRYTLRLLTAQQFQRAASLLCAMEAIRRENVDLGEKEFSIGIWLGGSTTPNTRQAAKAAYKQLDNDHSKENLFILTSCPWCGAKMGPVTLETGKTKQSMLFGYTLVRDTVKLHCPDHKCIFYEKLPVYVVDEDIYDERPTLVIGTVDKFAMLAWRPEARALFGLSPSGKRVVSPPGLIIQDELHLISGPLGSIVGLYEMLIEILCTDYRAEKPIKPKLVCSTATIRRFPEQVKALYARQNTSLFPPPGLEVSDSFFSRYVTDENGKRLPGKIYLGVNAPGLGSIQTTQVRTFATLLQSAMSFPDVEKDPWWTLLVFFNSLRELGTTLSLFQSDILNYLKVIRKRYGFEYGDMRRIYKILELTGRIRPDRIPEAITELKITCGELGHWPVDACLASNIIEVGIDIDRLSLMTVFGQPKSTSQYIQVTGRVGRRWWERPGLVVTIYSPSKPRDRSHFEQFRSYHERLYAQVEPTSATPFSPPAVRRALHAVLVGFARQTGNEDLAISPNPYPHEHLEIFSAVLKERVAKVDNSELENVLSVLEKRLQEWRNWESISWQDNWQDGTISMLRVPGNYASSEQQLLSWATPMSMRNIDAECQAEITLHYLMEGLGNYA